MTKRITFAQLERVLTGLGFRKKVVPKYCVAYEHPPTKTVLPVRLHKPKEIVPDYVMAMVRHQLEWQGVIETADLEELFQTIAA